jgi:uncharacterized protein (DUF305 family)
MKMRTERGRAAATESDRDVEASCYVDLEDAEVDEAGRVDPSGGGGAPVTGGNGRGKRFGTLALAVGLLLGYLAGLLTPGLRAPGDNSAEAGFTRDMITHHLQAIDMAMVAFQQGQLPEVRTIGLDLALGQQTQVGTMYRWLEEWKVLPTGSRPPMAWMPDGTSTLVNGLMPGMATDDELDRLYGSTGNDFDILFLQLMLRHHLGGIHMVDGVLEQSDRDQVVVLATRMKEGQQAEVEALRNLLTKLGARPL